MLNLAGAPEKSYKNPLSRRAFGVCLVFTLILCFIMGTIGYIVFRKSMMKQYEMNLSDIIELTCERIDPDDIEKCFKTNERSEKFEELSTFMNQIREAYALDHIALTRPIKEGDSYDVIQIMSGLTEMEKQGGGTIDAPIPYLGDRIGFVFPPEMLPGIYQEFMYSDKISFITTKTDYGNTYRGAVTVRKNNGEPVGLLTAGLSLEFIENTETQYLQIVLIATILLGIVFISFMILWLRARVIKPLSRIENAASDFESRSRNQKNPDVLVMDLPPLHTGDELESLSDALNSMSVSMKSYVEDLMKSAQTVDSLRQDLVVTKKQALQFSELAVKDALTGIRNKAGYDKEVEKIVKEFDEGKTRFGIAMIDLNYLKKINDEYGHEKGNIAIQNLCRLVCTVFAHSPVFRIGGDEFVAVLRNNDYDHIDDLIDEFNDAIASTGNDINLEPWERTSAAIGYALYTEGLDLSVNDVFRRADEAMYERKKEMKAARE